MSVSAPRQLDRWDGWDDPDYTPTQAELEVPITLPGIEDATPEDLARAIMRPLKGPTPEPPD